jgi:hypothetical protein
MFDASFPLIRTTKPSREAQGTDIKVQVRLATRLPDTATRENRTCTPPMTPVVERADL